MSFLRRDKSKSHVPLSNSTAGQQLHTHRAHGLIHRHRSSAAVSGASLLLNDSAASEAPSIAESQNGTLTHLPHRNSTSQPELPDQIAAQDLSPTEPTRFRPHSQSLDSSSQTSRPKTTKANLLHTSSTDDVKNPVLSFQFLNVRARQPSGRPASSSLLLHVTVEVAKPPQGAVSPGTLDSSSDGANASTNDSLEKESVKLDTKPELTKQNTGGYLPRLSLALVPTMSELKPSQDPDYFVKDNYKGFHRNKGVQVNVPPFAQPIKPRFKRKGNSLLGKLIHTNRKDSETSLDLSDLPDVPTSPLTTVDPTNSSHDARPGVTNRKSVSSAGSAKHKFRLPSISSQHHHSIIDLTRHLLVSEESIDRLSDKLSGPSSKKSSILGPAGQSTKVFNLDLNLEELQSILKNPPRQGSLQKPASSDAVPLVSPAKEEVEDKHSAWKAPDSWDVTEDGFYSMTDSPDGFELSSNSALDRERLRDVLDSSRLSLPTVDGGKKTEKKDLSFVKSLPSLFGLVSSKTIPDDITGKGPNHIIRVFKEDNTFTTILCPIETTSAELLTIIRRKFFLDSISNFQLSFHFGSSVKLLESFEKPLRIQLGFLKLSGYNDTDNLKMIGRDDLSFISKIVAENVAIRNLTHEEESNLSKDYVDVNISNLDLRTIPIIFHQHTYEIETLDVSDNPAIYIPLDFIQSCTNLSSIKSSRNGCSKFPSNFLEASNLTTLIMDSNYLDDIPAKIGNLTNLEVLRLNSNQLFHLPKAFGKLSNLTTLNLSSNFFSQYPECINELSNLQDLDLSYNDLSGIPDSIGKLTKLTKLNLSTNKLSKSLPGAMSGLLMLKRLDIRYNQILNIDVLGSLPNLEVMYASKNMISSFSDKMKRLRLLNFDRNPITSLEFEITLHMLTVLDLSKAKITAIPPEFISKISHIEKLVLDKNHLVTLPDELGNLPRLNHLSVFSNNIQNIPLTIGQLSSLQYLDLHANNIESIPSEIWSLSNLSYLNVASNILSNFPQPPANMVKKMSSTALSEYPEKKGRFSLADSLRLLSIADNRLNDDAFLSIALLSSLRVLNISYNEVNEIPDGALAHLRQLTDLYLSGNSLTKLPAEDFENLTELKWLFVNGNKLLTLPPELSKCQNLMHLDVGSNLLRYNIANWPYDWNWCFNKRLRYLNFSGNKRFEIKPSYTSLNDDTPYDSLLVLQELKVLGLMDVTLTTPNVPDQSVNVRVRTSSSELDNLGYGVSDAMGNSETVAFRDLFLQKFRGNENEVLIMSYGGIGVSTNGQGHVISYLAKQFFVPNFTAELAKGDTPDKIPDALRRAFLSLNKEVNTVLANKKAGFHNVGLVSDDLNMLTLAEDSSKGCNIAAVYIKNGVVYLANVGDTEVVLSKSNADYRVMSTKHDPTLRKEFERIRAAGGFVSGDGLLDGTLRVSRGVGFFDYIPHTHSGPSISVYDPAGSDAVIIMASRSLWDYVGYDLAVDIARQEKDHPMVAAEKLRDHAICYGAGDKISVTVILLGDQKRRQQRLTSLYMNLGHEVDLFTGKKKRTAVSGDSALRRLGEEIEPPVGKLALVFTDIKNLTLLWDAYPVAMRSAIKLHNTIMRRQLRIVGGYEVKTEGDSFMVSFPTPTSALLWCFNVQNQLLTEDWPTEILETNECCEMTDSSGNVLFRGLSVRMGIHWGSPVCELDMVTRRMDYFGPMVNRASRIESSADGGQIAVLSDFVNEMELLYFIHDQIALGSVLLHAGYDGNINAGEIIEREIEALEEIGCSYFELGERKLKGLETLEKIALAFPNNLALRYEIFKKRMSQFLEPCARIIGALPVESVLSLRGLLLRLERMCSLMSLGFSGSDGLYLHGCPEIYLSNIKQNYLELDVVGLFDHLVTRIEHCIAGLELRLMERQMRGELGIDFVEARPFWELIDEVKMLMEQSTRGRH